MPHTPPAVPAFTKWPSFPFEGEFRVKDLEDPVAVEPPRKGEGISECISCNAPDDAYIWISERWRVRAMDRPSGLPIVLILESRSHLDLGDLPNLLAAELGVMTVRLERAIRSLDGVARVHVNRWGDGSAHLHMWFLARPYGRLQLRGTFLSLWDDILPPIPESQWRENLALVAAWLAEFGGRPLAEPPRIQWQAPSNLTQQEARAAASAPPVLSDEEPGAPESDGEAPGAGLAEADPTGTEQTATAPTATDGAGEHATGAAAEARGAAQSTPASAGTTAPAAVSQGVGATNAGGSAAPRTNGDQEGDARRDGDEREGDGGNHPGSTVKSPSGAPAVTELTAGAANVQIPPPAAGTADAAGSAPPGPPTASGPAEAVELVEAPGLADPPRPAGAPVVASAPGATPGQAAVPAQRQSESAVGTTGPGTDATTAGRRDAEGGLPVPQ